MIFPFTSCSKCKHNVLFFALEVFEYPTEAISARFESQLWYKKAMQMCTSLSGMKLHSGFFLGIGYFFGGTRDQILVPYGLCPSTLVGPF